MSQQSTATVPSFHDGALRSITIADRQATLGVTRSDGKPFELRLDAVEALQADDFRLGNIISSVEVIRGHEPTGLDLKDRLERLFPSPSPRAESLYQDRYADFLGEVLARITRGDAALVIIESSYGCDLVAVCGTIEVVAV